MRTPSKKKSFKAWHEAAHRFKGNRKLAKAPPAPPATPALVMQRSTGNPRHYIADDKGRAITVKRLHPDGTKTPVVTIPVQATQQFVAHSSCLRQELLSRTMAQVARRAGVTKMMVSRFAAGTGGQDAHTFYAIAYAMGYTLTLGQNPSIGGFRRMPAIAIDNVTKGA